MLSQYTTELQTVSDALLESDDPLGDVFGTCFPDRQLWYAQQHHCKIPVAPDLRNGCPYVYAVSSSCLRAETRGACAKDYAVQIRSGILPISDISYFLMLFQVCVGVLT